MNLGCKVNRVESDEMAARLLEAGHIWDGRNPQVVVVNTCAVTGEAEKKTRKAVRAELRRHVSAAVLVTGCAAALDAEEFTVMDPRVRVVGKGEVLAICESLTDDGRVGAAVDGCERLQPPAQSAPAHLSSPAQSAPAHLSSPARPQAPAHPVPSRVGGRFPTRVGIKVQDGCNNACTFCIVHVARGRASSVPLSQVLETARAQVQAGARELVLTGINLGTYRDETLSGAGADLTRLVRELRAACPEARLRISSVEPCDVSPALVRALADGEGLLCRHLHLPLQSGSTRVLREMARPYTAERFAQIVEGLYARVPLLSLSTDIICGFPGETDEDFERTLEMARESRFTKIHVFRYSKRPGTPAAARPDQLPPHVIAERAHALQELARDLRLQEGRARLGGRELVLVEAQGEGMSESYYEVRTGDAPRGALVEATLTSIDEDGIFTL